MIRVMVMYPTDVNAPFNFDYWKSTHMPMCATAWPKLAKWEADACAPDSGYAAVAHLYFNSMEDLQESMGGPGSGALQADMPNYFSASAAPAMLINTVAASSG